MFTLKGLAYFALLGLARADFYFGVLGGDMEDGPEGFPNIQGYIDEVIMLQGQGICESPGFSGNPSTPSTNPTDPWVNWCGLPINMDGQSLMLDPTDDCGASVSGETTVPNGYFYANLMDLNNNNNIVGRCVFEQGGNMQDCGWDGSQEASTSIHCYTNALGETTGSTTTTAPPDPIPTITSIEIIGTPPASLVALYSSILYDQTHRTTLVTLPARAYVPAPTS
ncbi:hypothetical protein N7474_009168 [Penicillium riverlandense]|uniref:uncharacterized protein n=1 Tax=Penicillium riverlandense TaxID=1903569 RepID=UPI0025472D75|nr:uncharacterized protein N7474_009168 [Penicillium riverlandense]KAJ5807899.1 hypothetical protein N7474_009168 [Penicillium riverlandense]